MRTPTAASAGGGERRQRQESSNSNTTGAPPGGGDGDCGGGGEMARGRVEAARGSPRWWCSCKRITIVVCCLNLIAALFVLRWLYSLAVLSNSAGRRFSEYQIRRIHDSIRVRSEMEPTELVEAVANLRKEWSKEERRRPSLPEAVKQKLAYEILQRLKDLENGQNVTLQREMMMKRALQSNLDMLLEDIGLWIPGKVVNTEHDDKPVNDQELEEEIIPGRPLPPECHAEPHTDYDGVGVRWGLTHHKESAADCCEACLEQAKRAKPGQMKCNIWVYCPSEFGCHSPDIYKHKHQECWLKQAETPRLNFKDKYSESYRSSHPTAPVVVPWISGVVGA